MSLQVETIAYQVALEHARAARYRADESPWDADAEAFADSLEAERDKAYAALLNRYYGGVA